jgi:hypothetical protein
VKRICIALTVVLVWLAAGCTGTVSKSGAPSPPTPTTPPTNAGTTVTMAAILLDAEARRGDSPTTADAGDGKLREPVVMEDVRGKQESNGNKESACFAWNDDRSEWRAEQVC